MYYRIAFAFWSGGASCLAFALLIVAGIAMAPSRLDPIYPRDSYLPLVLVPIAIAQLMLVVLFVVALIIRSGGLFYCLFVWLTTLAVIMFICVIACAAGLLAENERLTNKSVIQAMQLYETNVEVGQFWDNYQRTELCCGYFGPSDWLYSTDNRKYPRSCCLHIAISNVHNMRSILCTAQYAHRRFILKLGCYDPMRKEIGFEVRYTTFLLIGIVVVAYNVVGILFSYFVAKKGFEPKESNYED